MTRPTFSLGGLASWRLSSFLALASLAACHRHDTPSAEPLRVAAAADLSFAFKDVGAAFEKETGEPVVFSFGATGLLEKQIAEGAPFDVFAAANASFVDDAVSAGACLADSRTTYAAGHLVMFTTKDSTLQPRALADLTDPQVKNIAIANPDHAPYGKAAKQALERAGVWSQVQPRIVYGENVQQALQFAQSGNADVAIVALSLATGTPGRAAPVPLELHDPIVQTAVVCTRGKAGATWGRRFLAFVQSPAGHGIMRQHGFLLPGESVTVAAGAAPSPAL
jgi:molybdate transport system substrate-binding protein